MALIDEELEGWSAGSVVDLAMAKGFLVFQCTFYKNYAA